MEIVLEELAELRIRLLEGIARGAPVEATLRDLCIGLEAKIADSVVGVTVLDRAARVFDCAIFPSIPKDFANALKGAQVLEKPGSCALAVYQGTTVISDDIANDPRFQDGWKALNRKHGLAAIQSRPIRADDGAALGTLVIA